MRSPCLEHPAAGIRLTGQVLDIRSASLKQSPRPKSESQTTSSESLPERAESAPSWVWSGTYSRFSLPATTKASQSRSTQSGKAVQKLLAVRVPSYLCEPINARVVDLELYSIHGCVSAEVGDQDDSTPGRCTTRLTWEWSEGELDLLTAALQDNLRKHDIQRTITSALPSLGAGATFPYTSWTGRMFLFRFRVPIS